jgi:hypothetical protein
MPAGFSFSLKVMREKFNFLKKRKKPKRTRVFHAGVIDLNNLRQRIDDIEERQKALIDMVKALGDLQKLHLDKIGELFDGVAAFDARIHKLEHPPKANVLKEIFEMKPSLKFSEALRGKSDGK